MVKTILRMMEASSISVLDDRCVLIEAVRKKVALGSMKVGLRILEVCQQGTMKMTMALIAEVRTIDSRIAHLDREALASLRPCLKVNERMTELDCY